ncbi:MAG TPA: hypothetical protein VEK07_07640 [Polyangiaceae bacterium]|nr:hypothetical protein [Polyangiaceae bacterium]
MRTNVDAQLLDEARRFAFRFACDHCAHFDPDSERCSLSFDPSPRRDSLDAALEPAQPRQEARSLELCKTFELG